MTDPKLLATFLSSTLSSSSTTEAELDQRLGLYRVFLKLYEHHRNLLDEILDLENFTGPSSRGTTVQYIQGLVQEGQPTLLITNLCQGRTQAILEPEQVWTIGRDRHVSLQVPDRRLSRKHAAIEYVEHHGFYLVDLHSTNGSYINGERVCQRLLLKDGDMVRLGSLTFSFFLCDRCQSPDVANAPYPNHQRRTHHTTSAATERLATDTPDVEIATNVDRQASQLGSSDKTFMFPTTDHPVQLNTSDSPTALSTAQQEEILDRFLQKQSVHYQN